MKGVAPQDRDVAMVFQGYALYPQMTARQIMEFPLKIARGGAARSPSGRWPRRPPCCASRKLLDRRPGELSGGERQRVAMGRAIVRKPRASFSLRRASVEPRRFATGRHPASEIGQAGARLESATALYVTHDHIEAMTLADRIAVMRGGKLLQLASPREIYERPATSFVGAFLGSPRMNVLPARLDDGSVVAGAFRWPCPRGALPPRFVVGVRPEHVVIGTEGEAADVVAVEPLGAETHLVLRMGELELPRPVPRLRRTPSRRHRAHGHRSGEDHGVRRREARAPRRPPGPGITAHNNNNNN